VNPAASRIVILGGGPAGYEAALVAAEHGADVTVVSDEGLGGNSVLWDSVPSKALVVAAEAVGWFEVAAEIGVAPRSDHDPVSTVDFARVAHGVLELGASQSADIERRVVEAGVRVLHGRGRLTGDRRIAITAADGTTTELDLDHALLATGSRARVLPFFEPDGVRVITGQQLFRLPALPEHLVVVGSGATGAEFAHAMRRLGAEVTLVSSRRQILPSEDPEAAAVIEAVFERRGMRIVREARASSCTVSQDGVVIGLEDGRTVAGSHVLFTVGQVPVVDGLGLEALGVVLDERGAVRVDRVGRTSLPWLYAAGDVTGGTMLASIAAMQGRVAMWHALGRAVQPIRTDAVAATIFTEPEVASVGVDEAAATAAGLPVLSARIDFRGNSRAKMLHRPEGFVRIIAMRGSGTVVGGVVVASRASDLVHPIAVAVQQRLTVAQLAQTLTVYPSMSGSVAECARILMERIEPA
jgi:pyruvate/2-oxoglutarate dehydrogenase complex dihydrolipoamide dehydrogenase (E3) component